MPEPAPAPRRSFPLADDARRWWSDRLQPAILRAAGRLTPSEQDRVFGITLFVGAVCGLVAVTFHLAIRACEVLLIERVNVSAGWWWCAWVVALPTAGGLAAGLALRRFRAARGSGIPQVKAAYAIRTTKLRFRDAVAKFVISALQIGSGASLGREGPTVQLCASVATSVGRVLALSPSHQRRLIPVGAAAGVAAAFNAPLAAVTFVIEELVGGLDTTVLSGVVIAAAIAAVVEHGILGEHPIFAVPGGYGLTHPSSLVVYAALGVAAGLLGVLFVRSLLALRARFAAMPSVPEAVRPALGGFATGCLAVATMLTVQRTGVTGGGYATLSDALAGRVVVGALAVLCVAKVGATVTSYASGGAGGIFAPSLFIGGMLGGLFGHLDAIVLGHPEESGAFALVGMGAFFAAVVRAPITSILIIFEMTRSYALILPLMFANTIAFLISRRAQRLPIYEALLAQDGIQLPHASSYALATIAVRAAMTSPAVCLDGAMTVAGALAEARERPFALHPVVDAAGGLLGVVSVERLARLAAETGGHQPLREHAHVREVARPGQSLRAALEVMNRLGVRQVVVVDDETRSRVVGMLAMSDVMRALLAHEPAPDSTLAPMGTPRPVPRAPAR